MFGGFSSSYENTLGVLSLPGHKHESIFDAVRVFCQLGNLSCVPSLRHPVQKLHYGPEKDPEAECKITSALQIWKHGTR